MSRSKSVYVIVIIILLTVSLAIAGPYENSRAIAVSGGENHTLVLTADANLWACGDNGWYQLGIGNTTTDQKLLVRVHGVNDVNLLENIVGADSGWKHSLAIDFNNNVLAWGRNNEGQLGNRGEGLYKSAPVLVHDGEMVTDSNYLENIIAVSAGRSGEYSLALDVNGFVWAWGLNNKGQLGNGESGLGLKELTPVQVKGEQPGTGTYLEHIVEVSIGWDHTLALEEYEEYDLLKAQQDPNYTGPDPNHQGRVYSWGSNGEVSWEGYCNGGQLGDGSYDSNSTPVVVRAGEQNQQYPDSNLIGIIAVSAGENHSIALDVNGFVFAWGYNGFGECDVPEYDDFTAIAAGGFYSLGLRADGSIAAWGRDHVGQLDVPAGNDFVTISAGDGHALALRADGTLAAWGWNSYGQCDVPDLPDNMRYVAIDAGTYHSLAIVEEIPEPASILMILIGMPFILRNCEAPRTTATDSPTTALPISPPSPRLPTHYSHADNACPAYTASEDNPRTLTSSPATTAPSGPRPTSRPTPAVPKHCPAQAQASAEENPHTPSDMSPPPVRQNPPRIPSPPTAPPPAHSPSP